MSISSSASIEELLASQKRIQETLSHLIASLDSFLPKGHSNVREGNSLSTLNRGTGITTA